MSIWKYFKRVPSEPVKRDNEGLPEPSGPLSKSVPAKAIELANAQVKKVRLGFKIETRDEGKAPDARGDTSSRGGSYLMLTPAQRYEIGKRAAEHGVTDSIRYFAGKYPKLKLKEPSVRRFKNLYKDLSGDPDQQGATITTSDEAGETDGDGDEDAKPKPKPEPIKELPRKKQGRPLLLPDELDHQVQEYIKDLRKRGLPVNTAVVIAAAEGILMNKNASLMSKNGDGGIKVKLTDDWAKSLLKRMGYVKRKACSKAKVNVERYDQLKDEFLLEIKVIVTMDEIPPELIINFDQTAVNYVPVSHWTMDKEGSKRVEVVARDDKRQITAVFAGSSSGYFLPPQLIYEGKTDRCLPHYEFPSSWHITKTEKHWSNEHTMREYFERIIFPYVEEKRSSLKLSNDQPALLIFDNFKAQCTPSILHLLDQHNINVVLIPPNCTDRLQPLDLSVNKAAKDFLRREFREWYAKQVCVQLDAAQNIPVDLRLSILKPLCAKWIESLYQYVLDNPSIVKNGFKAAGILEVI